MDRLASERTQWYDIPRVPVLRASCEPVMVSPGPRVKMCLLLTFVFVSFGLNTKNGHNDDDDDDGCGRHGDHKPSFSIVRWLDGPIERSIFKVNL